MKKRLLAIIDPQWDFVGGALTVAGGKDAMDRLANWLGNTNIKFEAIVMSRDWHPEDHCSFNENGGTFPKHCVQDTDGARYYKPVAAAVAKYCIDTRVPIYDITKGENKDVEEFSAFSGMHGNADELKNIIEENKIDEIWIAGLATDYCVYNSAVDILECLESMGLERDVDLIVMKNCMAAVDPEDTKMDALIESSDHVLVCWSKEHEL